MRSTTTLLVAASLLLFAIPSSASPLAELKAREIKKLIEEYCDSTDAARRSTIIEELRKGAPGTQLARVIKTLLPKEERRASALELCCALQVPKLYTPLKRYIEDQPADTDEGVFRACVASPDKGSTEFVIETWRKASVDSDRFQMISTIFQDTPLDIRSVSKFGESLKDDARKETCAQILKFQMYLTDEEVKELEEEWATLFTRYALYFKPITVRGTNLFTERADAWRIGYEDDSKPRGQRLGDRYLLDSFGELRLPEFGVKAFEITFHVLPLDLDNGALTLQFEGGGTLNINVVQGQWVGNHDTDTVKLAMEQNKWQRVTFHLAGTSGAVNVEGTAVATTTKGAPCSGILIRAGSRGRMIVAGADFKPM